MSKVIKAMELDDLRSTFSDTKSYVLLEPIKLDSATEYEFRKTLREKNIHVQLVKNSYAKIIFKEMGMPADCFSGPTLFCWGGRSVKELSTSVDDAVNATKKDPKAPHKLKIKTAIADGETVSMDVAKTLPTREEAIGSVISALTGAGGSLVAALAGPGASLASILKAIEEKEPSETAAPAA